MPVDVEIMFPVAGGTDMKIFVVKTKIPEACVYTTQHKARRQQAIQNVKSGCFVRRRVIVQVKILATDGRARCKTEHPQTLPVQRTNTAPDTSWMKIDSGSQTLCEMAARRPVSA